MISVATWSGARQKEREAYYKNDMLKKLADSQGPGAASALELMREEARIATVRMKQGLQIGGLITGAAGLGVLIFLRALLGGEQGVWMCGHDSPPGGHGAVCQLVSGEDSGGVTGSAASRRPRRTSLVRDHLGISEETRARFPHEERVVLP